MYKKDFEIRWSDVDGNGHMANSAYLNFMSHTRVGFLNEHGFSMKQLIEYGIGPVVFSEKIHYFKESFLGQTLTVTLAVAGLSDDGMFFKFEHNLYNQKGKHVSTCDILGAWMNLKTRSLTILPEQLKTLVSQFPKSSNFKVLTKEDTRQSGKRPQNLEL